MPETAYDGIWRWADIMNDLEVQGKLPGVFIDPLSVIANGCAGATQAGTAFHITWAPNALLMLTMNVEESDLVDAFTRVVGYHPFVKYNEPNGHITYEWDKIDPAVRLGQLSEGPLKATLLEPTFEL